jgi:hypothetical protein
VLPPLAQIITTARTGRVTAATPGAPSLLTQAARKEEVGRSNFFLLSEQIEHTSSRNIPVWDESNPINLRTEHMKIGLIQHNSVHP